MNIANAKASLNYNRFLNVILTNSQTYFKWTCSKSFKATSQKSDSANNPSIISMGNKIARTTQVSASEYYLHELPSTYNLVLKEVLGRGRFFKSIQCKHDEGLVLVKVYFKRGDSINLSEYERRISTIKEIFSSIDHPHVWPFQVWISSLFSLDFDFSLLLS